MSLTTLISNKDSEIGKFLIETCPKKEDYKTISGVKAFSGYNTVVPYRLSDSSEAGIVGTGFDYIARFMVAKKIKNNKREALNNLVAKNMIEILREYIQTDYHICTIEIMEKKYESILKSIEDCIMGYNPDFVILVKNIEYLVALEKTLRSMNYSDNFDSLVNKINSTTINKRMFIELSDLARIFINDVILSDIITEDSDVVFNPRFGKAARKVNGADADIYIDGVIYDFKTTKSKAFNINESAQLWGYYLLSEVGKRTKDEESSLLTKPVRQLGFYKARFGEIEIVDLSKLKGTNIAVSRLVEMLGYGMSQSDLNKNGIKTFNKHEYRIEDII